MPGAPGSLQPRQCPQRPLGRTGLHVSTIGFGAFKLGRNTGIKYANEYELPDEIAATALIRDLLSMGINLIDTAPAYGVSEERIGMALARMRSESPNASRPIISTKIGEHWVDGCSHYDYSRAAVRTSLAQSHDRLQQEALDIVLVHSNGDDLDILNSSDVVPVLRAERKAGRIRFIGFSGKTVVGARQAMAWADVLMVEYHLLDHSHATLMREAHDRGIGILVKKGLASGTLPAEAAIPFVLRHPAVSSMVIGGLSALHFRENVRIAGSANA